MAGRTSTTSSGSEEKVGLILAVALHAAVLAALLFTPRAVPPRLPERISVTLSDDVGLKSTSPEPAKAAPDLAPTLGEAPPPPAEPAPPAPAPLPQVAPPPPAPRTVAQPQPRAEPVPRPVARPAPAPPTPRKQEQPAPTPAKAKAAPEPARPTASAARTPPAKPAKHPGGQRIGSDFLKGIGADEGTAHAAPAAAIGSDVKASLAGAISRQIKPNWQQPDGVDVEKLSTTIEWDLNRDGSLDGQPRFVGQTGVNGSNRSQAQRHIEQAIRAVRLSAPFQLPEKYYAGWKRVRFTFDWKLNQ